MKVKLPAEPVDQYQRPGFITVNDAGIEVCENRLSYLVAKGGASFLVLVGCRERSTDTRGNSGAEERTETALPLL